MADFMRYLRLLTTLTYQSTKTKVMTTIYLLGLRRINYFKRRLSHVILPFKCSCGYRFYARLDDYWRFVTSSVHFEPLTMHFLMNNIRRDDIVLDVGAHIGIYTVHLAKKAKHVIAVEPEPQNLNLLIKNIKLNNVSSKVTILPVAACDYDGVAELYLHEASGRHSLKPIKDGGAGIIKVKCRKLGSLLRNKLSINEVNIIKIDVEGSEASVLKGLEDIILRNPPRILIVEVEKNSHLIDFIKKRYNYKHAIILDSWGHRVNVAFTNEFR